MVKNYITPQGFKVLADELENLQKVERPKTNKVVAWAASNGDRSENADYLYGKKRLREIDRRVRFLLKRLDKIEIINPQNISSTKIVFGATVTVSNEEDVKKKYIIVGEDEININLGMISWKSPIGSALLGKCIGEIINVKSPNGQMEYEILEIKYQEIL